MLIRLEIRKHFCSFLCTNVIYMYFSVSIERVGNEKLQPLFIFFMSTYSRLHSNASLHIQLFAVVT